MTYRVSDIEDIERLNPKSHTAEAVLAALVEGRCPVFGVDTEMSGNDDVVIMDPDEDEDDVKTLFVGHFELEEWPERWSIDRVELGEDEDEDD